jgi:hypothetical protein
MEATQPGCPVIVPDQPRHDLALIDALPGAGYRRHYD